MPAQQRLSRATHRVGIEPAIAVMPDEMPLENGSDPAVVDYIAVALPEGVADGMKARVGFGGAENHDVGRQIGIQRPGQYFGRQRTFGAEADDLSRRMDSGVGPSAGQHPGMLPRHLGNRAFKRLLDRHLVRLDLPARVGGSVVRDREFQSAHGDG